MKYHRPYLYFIQINKILFLLGTSIHFFVWLLWIGWLCHSLELSYAVSIEGCRLLAWNCSYKECKFVHACLVFLL